MAKSDFSSEDKYYFASLSEAVLHFHLDLLRIRLNEIDIQFLLLILFSLFQAFVDAKLR